GVALYDDYPPYVEAWLRHRPRGLVVMPAHEHNRDFRHPNVVRYDGTNLAEVERAMRVALARKPGEELRLWRPGDAREHGRPFASSLHQSSGSDPRPGD